MCTGVNWTLTNARGGRKRGGAEKGKVLLKNEIQYVVIRCWFYFLLML